MWFDVIRIRFVAEHSPAVHVAVATVCEVYLTASAWVCRRNLPIFVLG
jgi:hypothetical protein